MERRLLVEEELEILALTLPFPMPLVFEYSNDFYNFPPTTLPQAAWFLL